MECKLVSITSINHDEGRYYEWCNSMASASHQLWSKNLLQLFFFVEKIYCKFEKWTTRGSASCPMPAIGWGTSKVQNTGPHLKTSQSQLVLL